MEPEQKSTLMVTRVIYFIISKLLAFIHLLRYYGSWNEIIPRLNFWKRYLYERGIESRNTFIIIKQAPWSTQLISSSGNTLSSGSIRNWISFEINFTINRDPLNRFRPLREFFADKNYIIDNSFSLAPSALGSLRKLHCLIVANCSPADLGRARNYVPLFVH